jgi:membrane AbrB-like protein
MDTVLFLLLAYVGGTVGIKLKLPAGALLGSMLFVGAFSMTGTIDFDIAPIIRPISKIALGTMIGLMFTKEILKLPFKQVLSFILLGLGSVLSACVIAIVFHYLGFIPFITGMIAVAPGGIAEMLTLADSVDSNTQIVVMMHLIRFVTLMVLLRWLLKLFEKQGDIT